MVSSDVVGIGSEYMYFVVYLSCVYIYICSADYVELPVLLYLVPGICFNVWYITCCPK